MNIELHREEETFSSPIVGPGARLRIAREERGYTIPQVASYLHLTSQLIRDIENDDYSRAPQAVFMRGYLRSYSKVVDLSGDEIVTAFDALYSTIKKVSSSNHFISSSYKKSSSRHKLLLPLSIILLFTIIFAVLWMSPVSVRFLDALQQKRSNVMLHTPTVSTQQAEKPINQMNITSGMSASLPNYVLDPG